LDCGVSVNRSNVIKVQFYLVNPAKVNAGLSVLWTEHVSMRSIVGNLGIATNWRVLNALPWDGANCSDVETEHSVIVRTSSAMAAFLGS
jgi:hypothetical protein